MSLLAEGCVPLVQGLICFRLGSVMLPWGRGESEQWGWGGMGQLCSAPGLQL